MDKAKEAIRGTSDFQKSFRKWKFKYHDSVEDVRWFYQEDYDVASWDNLVVPSNWQMHAMTSPIIPILIIHFPLIHPMFPMRIQLGSM